HALRLADDLPRRLAHLRPPALRVYAGRAEVDRDSERFWVLFAEYDPVVDPPQAPAGNLPVAARRPGPAGGVRGERFGPRRGHAQGVRGNEGPRPDHLRGVLAGELPAANGPAAARGAARPRRPHRRR